MKDDNPAGRLYHILEDAKKAPSNSLVWDVWAEAIGVDRNDPKSVFGGIKKLIDLIQEAKESVRCSGDPETELCLSAFGTLDHLFDSANLTEQWSSRRDLLSVDTMTRLEFCSAKLSRLVAEQPVEAQVLDELTAEIEELLVEIVSADISPELKLFVAERLEEIRSSILYYRIAGATGLQRAVQSAVGAILLQRDQLIGERNQQRGRAIVEKFVSVVVKAEKVASGALKLRELGETVLKLLSSGNS